MNIKPYGPLLPFLFLASASLAQDAVQVMTAPFHELAFHPSYEAPAAVAPRNDSQVSAETTGVILSLHAEVGEMVEAGQKLATLDCRQSVLNLDRVKGELAVLQSQLDLAKLQLKRAKKLVADDHISQELYDMRESEAAVLSARILVAKAALGDGQLMVEKCGISAPFSGYIVERAAQKGQLAQPGAQLFRLVQANNPNVSAQLSMSLIDSLEQGVELAFSWNNQHYPLRLEYNPKLVNPQTRSREVRLAFTGESAPPGAAGRLVWKASWKALPAHLLVKRGQQFGVLLAKDNRALFHPLADATEGRPARAELDANTLIITEGRLGLEDKDAVLIK